MTIGRNFHHPRWLVVRGTGRRAAEPVPFGCNLCDRGRCRCLRDAWSFARLVGGEVMAVERVVAA